MPLFDYRCKGCGDVFEELVFSPKAEQFLSCPKCGSKSLERKMAPFAVGRSKPSPRPSCGGGSCSSCQFDD